MRPWIIGSNPAEPVGSSISDGYEGRVTDPLTGAGVFNPNLDPAVVGIDPLTGIEAPTGTDMSFGSAVRRQIHTNVINGDFAVLPTGGVGSLIDSDPSSSTYNPLPGWTWTPPADGLCALQIVTSVNMGAGQYAYFTTSTGATAPGFLSQFVAVPISQGQQYRVLLSVYSGIIGASVRYQFYEIDRVTALGSEITYSMSSGSEAKVDAGLVPALAAYVLIRIASPTSSGGGYVAEVRCAFLPAEASLGLKSLAAATSAITTTQTQVAGITIPAGTFTVGSTYRITGYGVITSSAANAVTFRVRCGTTTLTGNIAGSRAPTATTTASADGFKVEGLFTVRSVGSGGTCIANLETVGGPSQPFSTNAFVSGTTATVAVDTTVANILELTCVTAAGTTSVTFTQALIECVMAS